MHKFVLTEIFSITIAIILGLTFYILLSAGVLLGLSNFLTLITHLILIIQTLLLLAIFTQITRLEYGLRAGKPARRKR